VATTYDFDHLLDRHGTQAVKWDMLTDRFNNPEAIPLWVADMDFPTFPAIQTAIMERARHPIYGYTLKPPDYAEVVGGWLARRHGWHPDPEALVHVNGVVRGLATSIACFTAPGDTVLVLSPTYHPFRSITEQQGRQLLEYPLTWTGSEYVIDFAGLEHTLATQKVRAAIVCSPHNPVGRVWRRDELERLGQLLLEHDVLMLSDEVHSDLIYPEYHHIPLASINPDFAQHSITFVAASKTFGLAGLQTSVAIIPNPALREQFTAMQDALGSGLVNTFGIIATMTAFREGDEWLNQLLRYLTGTRDLMLKFFAENIPAIRPIPPQGTYLVWLDCRSLGLSDEELQRFMIEEAGIAFTPGTDFGESGQGFERMNLAIPRPMVQKALDQLRAALARR